MADGTQIIKETEPFFEWLATWYDALESVRFDEVAPDPAKAAILVADLIVGFCSEGPLASERVNSIVGPTRDLFCRAHAAGVRRFVLAQDTHAPDTPEFEAWPVHCVRGTRESEMVPELRSLPFASEFTVIEKNTLSAGIGTQFPTWLKLNEDVTHFLVTGDCTDLCTYNLAMFVRQWANAYNLHDRHVIVDAKAVQTFDIPVDAGAPYPHPGDFTHVYFLYHMALNGIRVVKNIDS